MGLDLGTKPAEACRLVIRQEKTSESDHFLVQWSDDKITWETVYEVKEKSGGGVQQVYSWAAEQDERELKVAEQALSKARDEVDEIQRLIWDLTHNDSKEMEEELRGDLREAREKLSAAEAQVLQNHKDKAATKELKAADEKARAKADVGNWEDNSLTRAFD